MKSNGHWDEANEEFYVSILANPNTMKKILNIENNYQVNFRSNNSLRKLLGFSSKTYSASQESERVVDILSVNSILVNLDIISGIISLNFNCLTFLFIFVQFCNFYFCTLGQINECVHSCVTFYFVITYQVERQLNFR